jgi:predicted RNA-binding Zn-ribbon protein involved in translation (DUF1610 family)
MILTTPAIALMLLIAALLIGLALIVYGSIAKTNWGVNVDAVSCPRCATQLDYVRRPQSRSQALWGGYTCPKCGCEVDKWGREIAAPVGSKLASPVTEKKGPPTTFLRLFLRNLLIFAPVLYAARVLLAGSLSWRDRLLQPVVGVIVSTLAFTALLKALTRMSRAEQNLISDTAVQSAPNDASNHSNP